MVCPVCGKAMTHYKEEACYSKTKRIEYKRTFYKCEHDDVWGRLEVPVGPMQEFDLKRLQATLT